ncbi:MAG: 1-acyl-sn-glycerol-3-phosphate acyltransferase [Gammaproteobacteria bacterium]|nr:1-acyl-sn-glycerol-3-phosphate acyltransferase [Gammaproteobacteria bacterium]
MQITYQLVWGIVLAMLLGWLWLRFLRACEAANQADWGGRWLNRLDGLNRLFCRHFHRLHYTPVPLPPQGGALVASNHVSGLDPLLLIAAARRPLRFIIAQEEYQRFGLNWLYRAIGCIPVERDRQPELALRQALRALQKGEVVAIFPHGRIHLDSDPPRKLKGGVASLAQLTGSPVYPVRLEGIRGQGHVFKAVVQRSHARLTAYPALFCTDYEACLTELAGILEGRSRL